MYLIVGLGNPEEDYSGTRHNMGFDTLNKLLPDSQCLPFYLNKIQFFLH